MDKNAETEQFEQWLPFFVNGRLGDAEKSWMQRYLAEHPAAKAGVNFDKALKAALHAQQPEWAADQGLQAMMRRIQASPGTATHPAGTTARRSWLDEFFDSLTSAYSRPRWALAATLLLLAQTGAIGWLASKQTPSTVPEYSEWRSVGDTKANQGPVLQITFKSTATEADIRLLLVKINGRFLGGPGQLGNYLVKVPADKIESARQQAVDSGLIESVEILNEMPVEP